MPRLNGVADLAVGVVGPIEPRRIHLYKGLKECEGGWWNLGQKLARHLVEPAFQHCTEGARFALAMEIG
jgi:hypothetical protein